MVTELSIIYIHGFASGKSSTTFCKISQKYPSAIALEYNSALPYQENIKSLLARVPESIETIFIGTSLGGYYAMQLAILCKTYSKCILINPAVNPKESLLKYVGNKLNFSTNKHFNLTLKTVQSYETIDMPKYSGRPTVVFLAKDDNVLNYKIAENLLKDYTHIKYILGGHRLSEYDEVIKEIEKIKNSFII